LLFPAACRFYKGNTNFAKKGAGKDVRSEVLRADLRGRGPQKEGEQSPRFCFEEFAVARGFNTSDWPERVRKIWNGERRDNSPQHTWRSERTHRNKFLRKRSTRGRKPGRKERPRLTWKQLHHSSVRERREEARRKYGTRLAGDRENKCPMIGGGSFPGREPEKAPGRRGGKLSWPAA